MDKGNGMADTYRIHDATLYDFTAGVFCGVLVPERVMRKLAALQAEHIEKVRRILMDNKDDLFTSAWTLYYPEGKQTTVRYIDTSDYHSVERSIQNATKMRGPEARHPVFYASSQEDAKRQATARYLEQNPEGKVGKQ